jgi:hypothetical protein
VAEVLANAVDTETTPLPLKATSVVPAGGSLSVAYDTDRGWYEVLLSAKGTAGDDGILRAQVAVTNDSSSPRVVRLNFNGEPFYIPGITAVLRDASQTPLGIPVQLSKNWHNDGSGSDPRKFVGSWFHGLTLLTVPANTNLLFELAMVGQNWGGLPSATHSQLSVIGYYNNGCSQWDEAALGNFGESLCYDPDHGLTDNDGTDSRPILLRDTNNATGKWCGNFGGVQFLRYSDNGGTQRRHSRMRTRFARYCPNLTEAVYAGQTDDGKMTLSYSAGLTRSDDYTRGLHQISVNISSNLSFSRLVFFQMPGDTYAYNNGTLLAYGNSDQTNALRQWTAAASGQNKNIGTAVTLTGNHPWVSIAGSPGDGTMRAAAKGYVIRSWKARLNGVDNVPPYVVEHSLPSGWTGSSLDLVPPPGVTTLKAGDYVQAVIERFYVPQFAGDYYGPDQNLAQAVSTYGNTCNMALREAVGNALSLTIQIGSLAQIYPTLKIVLTNDAAQFSVSGGLNYVPVTFTGASTYQNPVVEELEGFTWTAIDQAVNGHDFWQADYDSATRRWDLTYNLRLGNTNYQDIAALRANSLTRTFRFRNPNSLMWQISSLALTASPVSPSVYSQAVVFTAAVQADGATAEEATGSITFSVGGTPVETRALANGAAFYTNHTLNAGTYSVQAAYSGDNTFTASSNSLTHVVHPAASTVIYSGTTFVYNGTPQGPSITFSGSSGVKTTNYVGTGGTVYASVALPTEVGTYQVENTVAADSNYLGTNTRFAFTIIPPSQVQFTNSAWLGSGGFHLSGTGPTGQTWRLFTATNLTLPWEQWTLETSNNFSETGQFGFSVPMVTNAGAKFFRLVSP